MESSVAAVAHTSALSEGHNVTPVLYDEAFPLFARGNDIGASFAGGAGEFANSAASHLYVAPTNGVGNMSHGEHGNKLAQGAMNYGGALKSQHTGRSGAVTSNGRSSGTSTATPNTPVLPKSKAQPAGSAAPSTALRPRKVTQMFTVAMEERRYRDMRPGADAADGHAFGDKKADQNRICREIKEKTGVDDIELSFNKDQSLTVMMTGKPENVTKAKRQVLELLQTPVVNTIRIPKEHHRTIMGPKGQRIQELEHSTGTKIMLPRINDQSDKVTVSGSRDGVALAIHQLQCISDEQAMLGSERLNIPKIYHPFIAGAHNRQIEAWQTKYKVRVNVPPLGVQKDEIVVSGDREGVQQTCKEISKIHDVKCSRCQTVSVQVRKNQHRYIIGTHGAGIQEVLEKTGVSVEVPPMDNPSETVTLRGDPAQLAEALALVYAKANSVVIRQVPCPSWLYRHVIGPGGETIRRLTEGLPRVSVQMVTEQHHIEVEGPPEAADRVTEQLYDIVKELQIALVFEEINVPAKFHPHIIGKAGVNVNRIKQETGAFIRLPQDGSAETTIRIEGTRGGVKKAKQDLLELVKRLEQEIQVDIKVEHRFHGTLIGTKGANIRQLKQSYPDVIITFPEAKTESDTVQLRGPRPQVEACQRQIQEQVRQLRETNFQARVSVFKQFHKNIIGRGGKTIRQLSEEFGVNIQLPEEGAPGDSFLVTGPKAAVEKACKRIEAMQNQLSSISEVQINIPQRLHQLIIGPKGKTVQTIIDECGGVSIKFPPSGAGSDAASNSGEGRKSASLAADTVLVRGPKDDVERARKMLLQIANEKLDFSYAEDVHVRPEFHRYLIGRGGATIKQLRDDTGARFVFPSASNCDSAPSDVISIIGSKAQVAKAKKLLQQQIENLNNVVTEQMHVPLKYHRHFVARGAQVVHQVSQDFGNVVISFPRLGVDSDIVTLKGAAEYVRGAHQNIESIIKDLDAQVQITVEVPQKFHGQLLGPRGRNIQQLEREHNVRIKLPASAKAGGQAGGARRGKPAAQTAATPAAAAGDAETHEDADAHSPDSHASDGHAEAKPANADSIMIAGTAENCESAKLAIIDLLPITEQVNVPYEFHRQLIGQRGRDVHRLMEEFHVSINFPSASLNSDVVEVNGLRDDVHKAVDSIRKRVTQLQAEKEDWEARSYATDIAVEAKFMPKIIGKKGQTIDGLREKFGVNIHVSDGSASGAKKGTVATNGAEEHDAAEKNGTADSESVEVETEVDHEHGEHGAQSRTPRSDAPGSPRCVITITGYRDKADAARAAIQTIVNELTSAVTEEVHVDSRAHARLIGARGRFVRELMRQYKVDIKFPGRDAANADLVLVTGSPENVQRCIEKMQTVAQEHLQEMGLDQDEDDEDMRRHILQRDLGDTITVDLSQLTTGLLRAARGAESTDLYVNGNTESGSTPPDVPTEVHGSCGRDDGAKAAPGAGDKAKPRKVAGAPTSKGDAGFVVVNAPWNRGFGASSATDASSKTHKNQQAPDVNSATDFPSFGSLAAAVQELQAEPVAEAAEVAVEDVTESLCVLLQQSNPTVETVAAEVVAENATDMQHLVCTETAHADQIADVEPPVSEVSDAATTSQSVAETEMNNEISQTAHQPVEVVHVVEQAVPEQNCDDVAKTDAAVMSEEPAPSESVEQAAPMKCDAEPSVHEAPHACAETPSDAVVHNDVNSNVNVAESGGCSAEGVAIDAAEAAPHCESAGVEAVPDCSGAADQAVPDTTLAEVAQNATCEETPAVEVGEAPVLHDTQIEVAHV